VSSGPNLEDTGAEQFSRHGTFIGAIDMVFDLSNGGLNSNGEYVIDNQGRKVFSVEVKSDLQLLREIDADEDGLVE